MTPRQLLTQVRQRQPLLLDAGFNDLSLTLTIEHFPAETRLMPAYQFLLSRYCPGYGPPESAALQKALQLARRLNQQRQSTIPPQIVLANGHEDRSLIVVNAPEGAMRSAPSQRGVRRRGNMVTYGLSRFEELRHWALRAEVRLKVTEEEVRGAAIRPGGALRIQLLGGAVASVLLLGGLDPDRDVALKSLQLSTVRGRKHRPSDLMALLGVAAEHLLHVEVYRNPEDVQRLSAPHVEAELRQRVSALMNLPSQ